MKKLVFLSIFSACYMGLQAQGEVGSFNVQPKVGFNVSHLIATSNKPTIGLTAGLEWEYQMAENVSFSFGLLYSMQGVKIDSTSDFIKIVGTKTDSETDVNSTRTIKTNYIQMPIVLNMYLAKGLALKTGIQGALNISANGVEAKDFVLSVPVGISYEYHGVVLEGRYNIGIPKFFKDVNVTNNFFSLTIGKKFGR